MHIGSPPLPSMVSLLASSYHELQPSNLQANTLESRALGLACWLAASRQAMRPDSYCQPINN